MQGGAAKPSQLPPLGPTKGVSPSAIPRVGGGVSVGGAWWP